MCEPKFFENPINLSHLSKFVAGRRASHRDGWSAFHQAAVAVVSRSPKCNHPPDARHVGFDGLVIGMIVIGDTLSYLTLTDLSHV